MNLSTVPLLNVTVYNVSSGNDTNHTDSSGMVSFFKEEQIAFLVFLLIAILVGNSIVLAAVMVSRRKTRMTFFIMHLAIADLLVGIFSVLPDLVWKNTYYFYAGDIICRIVKFLQCLVTYGSTFVLVALSIDRLDAIARPLNFSRSWRRCKILIAVAWSFAALFSAPSLILFQAVDKRCFINLGPLINWQIYITLIAIVVFFIPAIIITFCYGAIICVIWTHNKTLHSITKSKEDYCAEKPLYAKDGYKRNSQGNATRYRNIRQTSVSSQGIIPQAKIRTIKMTFTIVLVFILCWSPYFIWNLLTVYRIIVMDQTTRGLIAVSTFINSLAPLNSAANPIIYGIFTTRICRYLRRISCIKNILDIFPCCLDPALDSAKGASPYTATEVTDDQSVRYRSRSKERQSRYKINRSLDSSSERTLVEKPQGVEMCDLILSSGGIPNGRV